MQQSPESYDLTIRAEAYYRPEEAAKRLGLSVRWLQYDRTGKRLIPYAKIGNQVIYCGKDLLHALQKGRIGGEAA